MKKLVLTMLAIMVSTHSTHTISAGAVAALTFIPIAIVTGIIVHKNNKKKHVRSKSIQAQKVLIMDLKEYKKEKRDYEYTLNRLKRHGKKDSTEALEHRSKIQELNLEIGDLEDRIEALN